MRVRGPVVAGQFYPREESRCRAELTDLLSDAPAPIEEGTRLVGGLVPHAGWMCSGAVAAKVFQALAAATSPKTIVLFGSVHRLRGQEAAMFADGRWETPIGSAKIDTRLAERILGQTNLITDDPYAHAEEHSIEVQIPFITHLFPEVKVLPIMVPAVKTAHEVGEAVGRTLRAYDYEAVVVGTTDLTHYGPNYGFTPHGIGAKGNQWAKDVNDKPFIELVCAMRAADIVREAREHMNACGAGATAATVGTAAALGASRGILLEHTTSGEVLAGTRPGEFSDSVGYAGILFTDP
ncbi:MAG: AmmeMemoRadiSam system protein B [Planctomycetota bacterium]|jgi:AmmeMemoRadiSam system protein B